MFGGSGLGGDSKSGDNDDLYDYSIDLNPTGAVPMTSGFGGGYQQFGNAAGGRMGSAMGGRTAMGVVPGTAMGGVPGSRMGVPGTAMGGAGGGPARPMTSVGGAGYQSAQKDASARAFDPLGQGRGAAPPLAERADNSPEDLAREMEKQVNRLIEASAEAARVGDNALALEKAKDAGKRERALCKHREVRSARRGSRPSRAAAEAAPHVSPPARIHTHTGERARRPDQHRPDLRGVLQPRERVPSKQGARERASPRPLAHKPSRPPI